MCSLLCMDIYLFSEIATTLRRSLTHTKHKYAHANTGTRTHTHTHTRAYTHRNTDTQTVTHKRFGKVLLTFYLQ